MVMLEEGSVSPQAESGWSGDVRFHGHKTHDWYGLIQIYDFIQLYFANEAEGVR